MLVSILVATPYIAFGELLRISLEDSGQYQVRLVQSAKGVQDASSSDSFQLAILDAALVDEPFVPLCMGLLEQQPGVRLIVIPPDNNPSHPTLGGLIPHGYLSRPFYLPELLDLVSRLVVDREKQYQPRPLADRESVPAGRASITLPPWLQDPQMLHKYLENQLAGTQAIAAIVGLNEPLPGGDTGMGTTRVSAGALNDHATQELTEVVFRYWDHAEKTDLMRFIRSNTDKKDLLVYATQITGELVLILVYDTSAPLSQIRPQTKALAQLLASVSPQGAEQSAQAGQPLTSSNQPRQSEPSAPAAPAVTAATDALEAEAGDSFSAIPPQDPISVFPPQAEPETQPLDDNLLFDRVNSSFPPIENAGEKKETSDHSVDLPDVEPIAGSWSEASPPASPPSEISFDTFMRMLQSDGEGVENGEEAESDEAEDPEAGNGLINLSALLGTVPPPNPEGDTRRTSFFDSGWIPERSASSSIPTIPVGLNGNPNGEKEQSTEQRPKKRNLRSAPLEPQTMPRETIPGDPALPVDYSLPVGPEMPGASTPGSRWSASLEVKTEPPAMPPGNSTPSEPLHSIDKVSNTPLGPEPPIDPLEDTRPNVVSTITSLAQLEPASPALSLLNYTCVLVPRLPQHFLTGELADQMAVWVQQLCLAFGWRLEGISIRPEYLQWTVQVAPAISPGNLIRIVRQRTSMHVFGSYPHLADQNPSGDFWATGYLIVSGAQPPSAQLLRDYIAQTRKRQGVNK